MESFAVVGRGFRKQSGTAMDAVHRAVAAVKKRHTTKVSKALDALIQELEAPHTGERRTQRKGGATVVHAATAVCLYGDSVFVCVCLCMCTCMCVQKRWV